MENASKALIMAAEVLIGVIILSIGAALFVIFSNYSKSTIEEIEAVQIAEFNNNFLKYENQDVTVHDIISIANFAKENNIKYELEGLSGYDVNKYYVQVDVKSVKSKLEKTDENYKNNFIKKNDFLYESDGKTIKVDANGQPMVKYYTCYIADIEISPVTKRVVHITFTEKN